MSPHELLVRAVQAFLVLCAIAITLALCFLAGYLAGRWNLRH